MVFSTWPGRKPARRAYKPQIVMNAHERWLPGDRLKRNEAEVFGLCYKLIQILPFVHYVVERGAYAS